MTLREHFENRFKKYFLHTNIPNNNRFIGLIKEYVCEECDVIKRTDEEIVVSLNFDDDCINIIHILKPNQSGLLFVTDIVVR